MKLFLSFELKWFWIHNLHIISFASKKCTVLNICRQKWSSFCEISIPPFWKVNILLAKGSPCVINLSLLNYLSFYNWMFSFPSKKWTLIFVIQQCVCLYFRRFRMQEFCSLLFLHSFLSRWRSPFLSLSAFFVSYFSSFAAICSVRDSPNQVLLLRLLLLLHNSWHAGGFVTNNETESYLALASTSDRDFNAANDGWLDDRRR